MTAHASHRVRFSDLSGDRPIVVLAPHPDDESLGCGGLLAAAFGGPGAHVVCMTDGSASHRKSAKWPPARLAARRREELGQALTRLGGAPEDLTWLGLPDSAMPEDPASLEAIAARIAQICRDRGAAHLFAAAPEDQHIDHKVTARIADLVAARCPGLRLFHYPVWSRWHAAREGGAVEGGEMLHFGTGPWRERKAWAIAAHASQLGRVVRDDPEGFVMEPRFVEMFARSDEVFREVPR